MSADRRERRVSRRFIVNGLGALTLAAVGAYAFGRPNGNGEGPLAAPPASLTLPQTSTVSENCMVGFKGDLLCAEPTPLSEPTPLPKATPRATLVQPLDDHYRGTADRVAGRTEIIGTFPADTFEFSSDIKDAGLIPSVFVNESAQERLSRSVDYIGRLHKFLSRKPEYRGKPLASLAINTQNFPIAFEKDVTIFEVLEDFLTNKAFGNVILDPNPVRGADFHLGTVGTPVLRNNRWEFSSETRLNMIVIDEKTTLEDRNAAYYQTTDLQFALKLLHEYSHFKQDQALMAEVMKNGQLMQSIGQDPEKMRAAIVQKAQEHKARIAQELSIQPGTFSPNEAQANTISQLALNTLEEINDGKRVPGAEDDNPIAEGNNSRLNKFRAYVLGNHVLDRRWLLMHNW